MWLDLLAMHCLTLNFSLPVTGFCPARRARMCVIMWTLYPSVIGRTQLGTVVTYSTSRKLEVTVCEKVVRLQAFCCWNPLYVERNSRRLHVCKGVTVSAVSSHRINGTWDVSAFLQCLPQGAGLS